MSFLAAALLLPSLFWTQGPQSAPALIRNGIAKAVVPANLVSTWASQSAIAITAADPADYSKLPPPGVSFRSQVASATREPWVDSNGWHYLRTPGGRFFYDAPGPSAALAAAEAFTFGGQALIKTDEAGLPALAAMLKFLAAIPNSNLRPVANVDFIDDGSSMSAECLNLLIRRNLLVQATKSPAAPQLLQVVLGSPEYPKKDASNPVVFAQQVRQHLTDGKRSLRIYGSDVVVGRLSAGPSETRVFLLNYGAGKYSIEGIRARVLGHFSKARLFDPAGERLMDTAFGPDASEFTVRNLKTFAIIDLNE